MTRGKQQPAGFFLRKRDRYTSANNRIRLQVVCSASTAAWQPGEECACLCFTERLFKAVEVNRHLNYYKLLLNIAGFVLPVLSSCASCSCTIISEGHQLPESRSSWDEDVGLAHAGLVRWQAALAGGEPLAGAGATSQCGGCTDGLPRSTPWSGCGRASSINNETNVSKGNSLCQKLQGICW